MKCEYLVRTTEQGRKKDSKQKRNKGRKKTSKKGSNKDKKNEGKQARKKGGRKDSSKKGKQWKESEKRKESKQFIKQERNEGMKKEIKQKKTTNKINEGRLRELDTKYSLETYFPSGILIPYFSRMHSNPVTIGPFCLILTSELVSSSSCSSTVN